MNNINYKEVAEKVKRGEITFQQYIDLREAYASMVQGKEIQSVQKVISILRPKEKKHPITPETIRLMKEVTEAMAMWLQMEEQHLNYNPSTQERQAGIEEYSKNVGWLGTAKTLAKAYATDIDTVLNSWSWAKVFQILRTDLLEYRYQNRLHKIMTK